MDNQTFPDFYRRASDLPKGRAITDKQSEPAEAHDEIIKLIGDGATRGYITESLRKFSNGAVGVYLMVLEEKGELTFSATDEKYRVKPVEHQIH